MNLPTADRIALHDLVHRYAADVDRRAFADVAGLFLPEGVLTMPDPPDRLDPVTEHTGHAAIQDALSALDSFSLTSHEVAGAVFDPDVSAHQATGRITCVAHHLSRDTERHADVVWHLRYHDRYTNIDGQWLFTARSAHIDFIETRTPRRVRSAPDR